MPAQSSAAMEEGMTTLLDDESKVLEGDIPEEVLRVARKTKLLGFKNASMYTKV